MVLTPDQLLVLARELHTAELTASLMPRPWLLHDRVISSYTQILCYALIRILDAEELGEAKQANAIEHILAENWEGIKTSPLNYFALPNHPITALLCEAASWVAETKNCLKSPDEPPTNVVKILMPSLSTQSIMDAYPSLSPEQDLLTTAWLIPSIDITKLLQTHVLDSNGFSLLPIQLLTELDGATAPTALKNPYFDYARADVMHPFVSQEDFERLCAHSPLTNALSEARQQYIEYLENDSTNLFTQLAQLRQALAEGDAHGGQGTQADAHNHIYLPLINFKEYYDAISPPLKKTIPASVCATIDTLLAVTADIDHNMPITAKGTREVNMETCAGTRGEALAFQLLMHENALIQITTHDPKLIENARATFKTAKVDLAQSLAEENYPWGEESRELTKSLVDSLNIAHITKIDFSITSITELENNIQRFSLNEIRTFFSIPRILQETLSVLTPLNERIDNLVSFCLTLSLARLECMLDVIGEAFPGLLDDSLENFILLLSMLSPERMLLLWKTLTKCGAHPILWSEDFNMLMQQLNPEQKTIMYSALKEEIPDLIQSRENYYQIMTHLTKEQEREINHAVLTKLPHFILLSGDFINLLPYIQTTDYTTLCHALKIKLRRFAASSPHLLIDCFKKLSVEENISFYRAIQPELPYLINTAIAYEQLFQQIEPSYHAHAFAVLLPKLPSLLHTLQDFESITNPLNNEQRGNVYRIVKKRLITLIKNHPPLGFALHLSAVLKKLGPLDNADLYQHINKRLPSQLTLSDDITHVFEFLNEPERANLYNRIKDGLNLRIYSSYDIKKLLIYLNSTLRIDLYERIKFLIPNLITNATHLNNILKYLDIPQRTDLFLRIRTDLPQLIRSAYDFQKVLEYLNEEQRHALYLAFLPHFPLFVFSTNESQDDYSDSEWPLEDNTAFQCKAVLCHLNAAQRSHVVNKLGLKFLLQAIHGADTFEALLSYLNETERTLMYESYKACDPALFAAMHQPMYSIPERFAIIVKHLNTTERAEVFMLYQKHLNRYTTTAKQFGMVSKYLKTEHLTMYCNALKIHGFQPFNSSTSLLELLLNSSPEQRAIIYNTWQEKVPELIRTSRDLAFVCYYLDSNQCSSLCRTLTLSFKEIIPTKASLIHLMKSLDDPLQRKIIYETYTQTTLQASLRIDDLFLQKMTAAQLSLHKTTPRGLQRLTELMPLLETFESALTTNAATLQSAFDALIKKAERPRRTQFTLFASNHSQLCTQIINALSRLDNVVNFAALNAALSLQLTAEQLASPRALKSRLERYVNQLMREPNTALDENTVIFI